jgi:hypothetical protein
VIGVGAVTTANECGTDVECTISGEFGQLQHIYSVGREPQIGEEVHVWTSADGTKSLVSSVLNGIFGYVAWLIGAGVLSLVWLILLTVRLVSALWERAR